MYKVIQIKHIEHCLAKTRRHKSIYSKQIKVSATGHDILSHTCPYSLKISSPTSGAVKIFQSEQLVCVSVCV